MIRLFNRYWPIPAVISLIVEATLLVAVFAVAHRLRSLVFFGFGGYPGKIYTPLEFSILAGTFTATVLLWLYVTGLYEFNERTTTRQLGIRLLQTMAFSAVSLFCIYFIFPSISAGRGVFMMALNLALLGLSLWRLLLTWFLNRYSFAERLLIVGSDEAAKSLAREVMARRHLGYRVVGFLSDDPELQGVSLVNPRILGRTADAYHLALAHHATRVVVAQQDSRGKVSMDSLLSCRVAGVPVSRGSTYYEELTGKLLLDDRRIKSWLIFSPGFSVVRSARLAKRGLDLILATVGSVLAAPLMLAITILVRLDSPGGALFHQERVGLRGKRFKLWKFRTMRADAESAGDAKCAEEDDPRITRVGRLLRRFRLDELPQLWNVLKGDMSLVGPRPERPALVDELTGLNPLYEQRFVVRPGLTGWAQVRAPYAASLEDSLEKLRYDLYYIKNISTFLDISILASSFRIVILGRRAR